MLRENNEFLDTQIYFDRAEIQSYLLEFQAFALMFEALKLNYRKLLLQSREIKLSSKTLLHLLVEYPIRLCSKKSPKVTL